MGDHEPHMQTAAGAVSFHFEPQRMIFDRGFFLLSFLAPARERKAGCKSNRILQ